MSWEAVIGLEVHVRLKTQSKLFSGASTAYGAEPNTQASLIDLAYPGTLPVLNEAVVKMAVKFGLATNADICERTIFARKNYFYPDLPKGYQISQFEDPIVSNGQLNITLPDGETKTIGITRAHIEEDAGKSLHEDFHGMSGIDLNRAGIPLLEVVSEPELHTAVEAVSYLKTLHSLVQYLDICDGNLQEGSFRCDANVSVRPKGTTKLGTRCEIKNINSFRFVEKAINFEIERQIELIEAGGKVEQQTRLYDSDKDETRPMRGKEEANDYRYFPDPDLLPVAVEASFIEQVAKTLPELPSAKKARFIKHYHLSQEDAAFLTGSKALADYYEAVVEKSNADPKLCANWCMGELTAALKKADIKLIDSPVNAQALADLMVRISDKTISGKIAKSVFDLLWNNEGSVDQIIEVQGLKQVTDTGAIEKIVDEIIQNNPAQVEQYLSGKDKVFGFFVGQVMKASKGKANPEMVNELLKSKLKR